MWLVVLTFSLWIGSGVATVVVGHFLIAHHRRRHSQRHSHDLKAWLTRLGIFSDLTR